MKLTYAATLGVGLFGMMLLATPGPAGAVPVGQLEAQGSSIAGQRIRTHPTPGGQGSNRSVGLGVMSPSTEASGEGGIPTAPVPEPGTMALASMGLLSLGAALHRRFGGSPRQSAPGSDEPR